jgi:hypothetical protein
VVRVPAQSAQSRRGELLDALRPLALPFRADEGSPFFFKLKARYSHAVCGFAYFARFARLPDWLAWESFGAKNGCPTLESMRERIGSIRERIDYRAPHPGSEIGCILLAQPTFFAPDAWIDGPTDWPSANLRPKKYDLNTGEGLRLWNECRARAGSPTLPRREELPALAEPLPRFGVSGNPMQQLVDGHRRSLGGEGETISCDAQDFVLAITEVT